MSDVGHLTIEMDRCNQPKFVAADIEHEEISNSINAAECRPQISEMRKPVRLQKFAP
jgi:hypothetical protein